MSFSDQSYNLRIELDTKNCDLGPTEIRKLESAFDPLRGPIAKFPVSDLYVTIEFFENSHDYRIKIVLRLPKRELATGDIDKHPLPAVERSIRKLVQKVIAYEGVLEGAEATHKRAKGTRQDVVPASQIDADAVQAAIDERDYSAFRHALYPYEEAVRKRVGRWVQRYPAIEARIGISLEIADVVEEVFLNAFERSETRHPELTFGEWLERLIDPSLHFLAKHPEELENVQFARSWSEG